MNKATVKCPKCGFEFETSTGVIRAWCFHCGDDYMRPVDEKKGKK